MNTLSPISPFKFWCQKVLPLVYDDSLSYYELLCKVVKYLNEVIGNLNSTNENFEELVKMYDELKSYVDNYFANLDVQNEINIKLDKMAEDGTLATIINQQIFKQLNERIVALEKPALSDSVQTFNGFNQGFRVNVTKDFVTQIARKTVTASLGFKTDTGTSLSAVQYLNLDFPITEPILVGNSDSFGMYVTNANRINAGRLSYRIASPYPFDATHQKALMNFAVFGKKAIPDANPKYGSGPLREEALAVAKTYWQAKQDGRKFAYGNNFIYYSSNAVNNDMGEALMECDTLVFMIMSGIRYEDSPYTDTTPNLTYDFANLVINPHGYKWAFNWKNDETYGGRITNTSSMNWYNWQNGLQFSSLANVQTGDIAIFRRASAGTFDNVGHVGFIELVEENGVYVPWVYNVSASAYTEGNILDYTRLTNFYTQNQGRYRAEDTYFMRPNYTDG